MDRNSAGFRASRQLIGIAISLFTLQLALPALALAHDPQPFEAPSSGEEERGGEKESDGDEAAAAAHHRNDASGAIGAGSGIADGDRADSAEHRGVVYRPPRVQRP